MDLEEILLQLSLVYFQRMQHVNMLQCIVVHQSHSLNTVVPNVSVNTIKLRTVAFRIISEQRQTVKEAAPLVV